MAIRCQEYFSKILCREQPEIAGVYAMFSPVLSDKPRRNPLPLALP